MKSPNSILRMVRDGNSYFTCGHEHELNEVFPFSSEVRTTMWPANLMVIVTPWECARPPIGARPPHAPPKKPVRATRMQGIRDIKV